MDNNIDYFRDLIGLIGVAAAIWGGILAFQTFTKNNKQKRFEFFYDIYYNNYLTVEPTSRLFELFLLEENIKTKKDHELSDNDRMIINELREYPIVKKYFMLGMFEQVAIALNSGLISETVAHHMFGYFAIYSFECKNFWHNMPDGEKEKNDPYWGVYFSFVKKMKEIQNQPANPNEIKF